MNAPHKRQRKGVINSTLDNYFMEDEFENDRLNLKTDRSEALRQLMATGLCDLQNRANIVDAGCGGGFVSEVMANYLAKENRKACLTLIDKSEERLDKARALLNSMNGVAVKFINCFLENIPLPSKSQDYVFSRFVFEYLQDPQKTFSELYRITKIGGKLVIGDLDGNCLTHYQLPADLEKQLVEIAEKLYQQRILDPWIGRKLYSFFYDNKMKDVKVHVEPHHLFYGKLSNKHLRNWTAKLDQLIKYQEMKKLTFSFDVKRFKEKFLPFLLSEGRFSYTPIVIVEGIKKHG